MSLIGDVMLVGSGDWAGEGTLRMAKMLDDKKMKAFQRVTLR